MMPSLAIKAKREEDRAAGMGWEGAFVIEAFVSQSNCYMYWSSASPEVARDSLLMGKLLLLPYLILG